MAAHKLKVWLLGVLASLGGIFLLMIAYHLFVFVATTHQTLSCHIPASSAGHTQYCVYYTSQPGFLLGTNRIVIGPSPSRGVEYTVPHSAKDLSITWDEATDALTVTMPGARLVVERRAYEDTR